MKNRAMKMMGGDGRRWEFFGDSSPQTCVKNHGVLAASRQQLQVPEKPLRRELHVEVGERESWGPKHRGRVFVVNSAQKEIRSWGFKNSCSAVSVASRFAPVKLN